MSEDDFFEWLTTKGLSERDSRTMKGTNQNGILCVLVYHVYKAVHEIPL